MMHVNAITGRLVRENGYNAIIDGLMYHMYREIELLGKNDPDYTLVLNEVIDLLDSARTKLEEAT